MIGWRSVRHVLPDVREEVLVWVDGHRGPSWRNNHALVAYRDALGSWWEERHAAAPLIGVLYWHPLPAPPNHCAARATDSREGT